MGRTTRIWNISLPPELAEEAESLARREFRTRSELVREALRRYLWTARWEAAQGIAAQRAVQAGLREEDIEGLVNEVRKQAAPRPPRATRTRR